YLSYNLIQFHPSQIDNSFIHRKPMTAFGEIVSPSPCCKICRSNVVFPEPVVPVIAMVLPNGNSKLDSQKVFYLLPRKLSMQLEGFRLMKTNDLFFFLCVHFFKLLYSFFKCFCC